MSVHWINPYRFGAGAPAALVAPTDVAGCQLWLRADQSGLSDGAVTTWTDQSSAGHNATGQGTTKPTKVSGVVNGLPVMRFNGSTAYFTLPNYMTGFTASTWGMALKIDADPPPSGGQTGIFWMSNSSDNTHYPWTDSSIYVSYGRNNRYNVNPTPSLAAWHRLIITVSASAWSLYLNGTAIITQGAASMSWPTGPLLGKSKDGFFLDGDVTDVVQYDSVLSAADRARLDDWLADRIGA